jgi:hypothetical protein
MYTCGVISKINRHLLTHYTRTTYIYYSRHIQAASWLWWQIDYILLWRHRFNSWSMHVGFETHRVAMGQVVSEYLGFVSDYLGFPLSVLFHRCSMFVFILVLLFSERRAGEVCKQCITPSDIREHWTEKYCHILWRCHWKLMR